MKIFYWSLCSVYLEYNAVHANKAKVYFSRNYNVDFERGIADVEVSD